MSDKIYTIDEIKAVVKPIAEKYDLEKVYLFGSYARGEANEESDIDILIKGKASFRPGNVFAIGEEVRVLLKKAVDIFEVRELEKGSAFYEQTLLERVGIV